MTFEKVADDLFKTIKAYVDRRLQEVTIDAEILGAMEQRMALLESAPFEYVGAFEQGKSFRRGQFASQGGSVWFAKCSTTQRPGDGNDWQLAVKAGRDAR